jgi:transcriptional regulator with XRE-family HTH domain
MDDAAMAKSQENQSAIALKRLRERADLSMRELAELTGFKTASGIQRYEDAADRTSPWIAIDVVDRLARALKGRGSPPITEVEVFLQLGGALPPRLVSSGVPPTLTMKQSKPTKLPDGSKGLGIYTEEEVLIRLKVTVDLLRALRDDVDYLEDELARRG